VFRSSRISKGAAVQVLSAEIGIVESTRSLKTLVKKSLIDEDSGGESYSIHPLIYSFVVEKAKGIDFENVVSSSRLRFCSYYLLLFEKFNDDFLAGKSIDSPQLEDTMEHLATVMGQSLTHSLQDLIRILSKCEVFLFLIYFPWAQSLPIPKLYDLVIEKSNTQEYDCSKLYVSKRFGRIVVSSNNLSVSNIDSDIPEQVRANVILSTDGSAAKLGCYEGIFCILKGNRKSGVEQIEKHLDGLANCPDQQLIKCLCLQLLALYYTEFKQCSESNNFSKKAMELCHGIGNYNLFLIDDCEQSSSTRENKSNEEQLIIFLNLLCFWSEHFLSDETANHLLRRLKHFLGNKPLVYSSYLISMITYYYGILPILRNISGHIFSLDGKTNFLDNCLNSELTGRTVSSSSHDVRARLSYHYSLRINIRKDKTFQIEKNPPAIHMHRSGVSLKFSGTQNKVTAIWHLMIGLTQQAVENHNLALDAFDQVFGILETADERDSSVNDILVNAYLGKGRIYECMNKYELAIESFEAALRMRRKLASEDTEEIVEVLFFIGLTQRRLNDFTSALATLQRALEIAVKLHASNRCFSSFVIMGYCNIAHVHNDAGNNSESVNVIKTALELAADWNDEHAQLFICSTFLNQKVNEKLYMESFHNATRVMKEKYLYKPLLAIMDLKLAEKQLESGKLKDSLASLQEALDIKLDDTMLSHIFVREATVICYTNVVKSLVRIEMPTLAEKIIDRATKIAESLSRCKLHLWLFRCYFLKGFVFNEMREYVAAIESLEHALLVQLPKLCHEFIEKYEEFDCRRELAKAYYFKESYEKALTSDYHALSVIKDVFSEGSEHEGDVYFNVAATASKMKNKSLVVNNLHLAYKMYSKILGRNHPKTELCYIDYARALINC
jgi:tetratricopeptide (TPR) repeat protein